MNLQDTGNKFVEMCNQFKNFDVMHTMYDPAIVSAEGDGKETKGQEAVIRKSEIWQGNNNIHSEHVRGPYFNGSNRFAAHFTLEVTRKDSGKRETIEEVGIYTVNSAGKIVREEFFYIGVH